MHIWKNKNKGSFTHDSRPIWIIDNIDQLITPSVQFLAFQQIGLVVHSFKSNQVHCLTFAQINAMGGAQQEADGRWGQIEFWLFFLTKIVIKLPKKGSDLTRV